MTKKELQELIKYWQNTAEHDYETMISLFKSKRYSSALFFGHIILEKILKGLVVENTKEQAPRIHDLVRLEELTDLNSSNERKEFLKEVNTFNIRTRYPDYRLKFYKLCTKDFSQKYFNEIIKLYKELCQKLKQKK